MIEIGEYDKERFKTVKLWKNVWLKPINRGVGGATGMQDDLIKNYQEGRLIKSHTRKNGYMLGYVNCLKTLVKEDRGIYEILMNDCKRRIYFDIDAYDTEIDVLQLAKNKISDVFPNAVFSVSGSIKILVDENSKHNGQLKTSYRIVVNNWYASSYLAMLPIKVFINNVNEEVGFDLFDCAPYQRNQSIKTINQSKCWKTEEERRIQAIIEDDNEENHFICEPFNIDISKMYHIDNAKIMQSKTKAPTTILVCDLPDVSDFKGIPIESYKWETATPLETLKIIPNLTKGEKGELSYPIIWQILLWCQANGITWLDFWTWNSQRGNSIERFEHYKKQWDIATDKYKTETNQIVRTVLEMFYKGITKPNYSQSFMNSFKLNADKFIEVKRDLELSDMDVPNKHIILATPMGSRKTGVVIDYLNKYKFKRVLFMSPRITFSNNLVKRYKSAGIEIVNYRKIGKKDEMTMKKIDKLTMSSQSCRYCKNLEFDLIVFDECETILNTFIGDCATHYVGKKPFIKENFEVLVSLIKNTQKIIWMDAFTSSITLNFINSIEGETLVKHSYIVDMVKPIELKNVIYYDDKHIDGWLVNMIKDINAGLKIYIFHPNKNHQDTIDILILKGGLKREQILDYYGGCVNNKNLADVNTTWADKNIKVVMTNSAITVGVNFDVVGIFDKIYADYGAFVGGRDFVQSMMRIRQTNTKEIHLMVEPYRRNNETELPSIVPSCNTWKLLQNNINKESGFYKNVRKSLFFFFEMAGFTISFTEEMIDECEKKLLYEGIAPSDSIFDFQNIPMETNVGVIDEMMIRMQSDDCNDVEKLIVSKYLFLKKFNKDSWENPILSFIWNKKYIEVIDKINFMDGLKIHYMWDFYNTNGIGLTDVIPRLPKIGLSNKVIKDNFKFDVFPKNNNSHTVSKILNTFWGKNVYSILIDEATKKPVREEINNKEYKKYTTNEQFIEVVKFIRENRYKPINPFNN